jgi:sec-independent protein translocase protein TatA
LCNVAPSGRIASVSLGIFHEWSHTVGEIGLPEVLMILAIAVVVFGAKKIPEIGRGLGEGIRGFREAMRGEEEKPRGDAGATEKKQP